jgi:hypothetical protein
MLLGFRQLFGQHLPVHPAMLGLPSPGVHP